MNRNSRQPWPVLLLLLSLTACSSLGVGVRGTPTQAPIPQAAATRSTIEDAHQPTVDPAQAVQTPTPIRPSSLRSPILVPPPQPSATPLGAKNAPLEARTGVPPAPTPAPAPTATPPYPTLPAQLPAPDVIRADNAAQLTPLGRLGRGAVQDLAWSPDGSTMALATTQGIYLCDAATQSEKGFLSTPAPILGVAFSPDGSRIAGTAGDRTVRLWKAAGGTLVHAMTGHAEPAFDVVFSPDGQWLASGGRDETVRIWDARTGQQMHALSVFEVSRFILSPGGRWIAVGGGKLNRLVQIWDPSTGQLVHQLEILPDLLGMAFSPDGRTLAAIESGAGLGSVILLDLDEGRTRRLDHADSIRSVAFSPDGSLLATGDADKTVGLWDVATGQLLRTLGQHADWPYTVAFSPNGAFLASADADEVRVWDVSSGETRFRSATHATNDLVFSPDGSQLAIRQGATARLIDMASGQAHDLRGHAGLIASLAFSHDSHLLAAGDWNGLTQLWELDTGKVLQTFRGHVGPVGALAFSPDDHTLASGGINEDHNTRLWDLETGQIIETLTGDPGYPTGRLNFSPDGHTLAGGTLTGVVLWELGTGHTRRLDGHTEGVLCVAISPDGSRLASGSFDTTVIIWDLATGQRLHTLPGHGMGATSLIFSPDGAHLISGDQQHTIRVWDVETGGLVHTIPGRGGDLALSPDGTLLGFKDTMDDIVLWDMATQREVHRVGAFRPIAFSPDGRLLISGTPDGVVVLWGVPDHRSTTATPIHPPAPTLTGSPVPSEPLVVTAPPAPIIRNFSSTSTEVLPGEVGDLCALR